MLPKKSQHQQAAQTWSSWRSSRISTAWFAS